MSQHIGALTLLVRDYDEAVAYYTTVLGFELLEDSDQGNGKRWVVVAPVGATTCLLLAKAATEQQSHYIGNQTGGRVFLFLHTTNFATDYVAMQARGVTFLEEPRYESYGSVVVFQDLYGNKWDLLGPPLV